MAQENNTVLFFAIAILVLLVALLVLTYTSKCKSLAAAEKFTNKEPLMGPAGFQSVPKDVSSYTATNVAQNGNQQMANAMPSVDGYMSSDPLGNSSFNAVEQKPSGPSPDGASSCFPRDTLTASDLLPADAVDSKWSQMNPSGNGSITDGSFLNAGYHVGISTKNIRNANLQLRSEVPNPTDVVSPFLQSTISPHYQRPLEIGSP
jgi:hypothetical protein